MQVEFKGHSGHAPGHPVPLADCPERLREAVDRADTFAVLVGRVPEVGDVGLLTEVRSECHLCGDRVRFDRNGGDLVAETTCVMHGVTRNEVPLDVPSGVIVFANDLRSLVVLRGDLRERRGLAWRTSISDAYAAVGMAHVFVGNTCPDVVRRGSTLVVESGRTRRGGRRVGNVTTDLWWISAMDRDHFLARCADEGRRPEEFDGFEVEVGPGTYLFEDHLVVDRDRGTEHCTIRPSPVRVPLVVPDRPHDAPFADGHFARFRLALDMEGSPGHLVNAFHVGGNGLRWIDGVPSEQTRRPDPAFASLEGREPVGHPRSAEVPALSLEGALPWFEPVHVTYPQLVGRVPEGVDPAWLAAALMVTKGLVTSPRIAVLRGRDPDEVRRSHLVVLDVLCELGEARGLFDGRLQALFPQVADHVAALALAHPREARPWEADA